MRRYQIVDLVLGIVDSDAPYNLGALWYVVALGQSLYVQKGIASQLRTLWIAIANVSCILIFAT